MKQKWRENLKHPFELEYLEINGVPMRRTKRTATIDLRPLVLERIVASEIVRRRIPIRGKELKLLRTALDLSLEKFGRKLGITSGAVFHWERLSDARLLPINEVSVRALCAEELNVDLPARFSKLLGVSAEHVVVEVPKLRKTES